MPCRVSWRSRCMFVDRYIGTPTWDMVYGTYLLNLGCDELGDRCVFV